MLKKPAEQKAYLLELEELRARLVESEDALRAIRSGEVDALVVPCQAGEQVFTLKGADRTFRVLIEDMNEGALTLTAEGIILYANRRLGEMLKSPIGKVIGSSIHAWIAPDSTMALQNLLRRDDTQIRRRGEVMLLASDGTLMPGYLSLNMLQLEDMQGYFCMVATDLTEQKSISSIIAAEDLAQKLLASSEQSRLVLLSIIEDQQQVSDALQESEKKYRTLIETTPCIICKIKPDGTTLYVNSYIKDLTGYAAEELIGRNWWDVFYPGDLIGQYTLLQETFKSGDIRNYKMTLVARDGSFKTFQWNSFNILGKNNELIEINGVGIDVTEQKQAKELLEQSFNKLQATIEALPDTMFEIDQDGRIIDYHAPEHEQLYVAPEFFINKIFTEVIPESASEIISQALSQAIKQGRHKGAVYYLDLPTGREWFELSITMKANKIGKDTRFIVLAHNITKIKNVELALGKSEEKLARLNEELEQRVITRTAEMENANKELESFSYTVSHDLRAPLRHINGFLTMFRNEVGDTVNEKALHYMEVITESAGRMGQLIDDLLSFSRMGRTELTIRTVDIGKLADEVLAGFSEEIGEKNIIVARGLLPLVQGDEAMLRVVLTNLISNAVKFTSRTENRRIEIGCVSNNGESICHVKDNGAGFDMRYADKLFGVFQRLHNERDFEGTGIGLATVKRIIQHHGGRVWAEGEVDRGARFYFSLPAGSPGPVGAPAS